MQFRVILLALCTLPLIGQYTTGRVEGFVSDASGATVAAAHVTLTSRRTNVARSVQTTVDGSYVFASVPPGTHRLTVEKPGFAVTSADVAVVTSGTVTHNFTLDLEQRSTAIEVVAEPVSDLNASDPQRSITRNELEIQNLPNLARNSVALLSLSPGVQPTFNPRGGSLVTVSGAQAGQIAANGGRSKATSHQLDFTDANDWEFGGIALNTQPAPEMLQELRVLTNNWSAEYGVKASAQVVMVTRSGTNSLHGGAYDYLQNSALNARDYFDRTGSATPLRQNYFGGNAGAPVIKDRTFVFGAFEGRETRGAGTTVVAVLPTAADRERATNSTAKELMDRYLPTPSANGTLSSQLPNPAHSRMFLARGDHYFSPNHSLTARYFQHIGSSYLRLANTLPGFDATFDPDGRNAMLADTWFASAQTTNELRIAYGRSSALFTPEDDLLTPRFTIAGLVSFGTTNSWPQGRVFNVYQINDVLNVMAGRHALKFGFDLRHIQDNSINDSNRRGVFTFASLDTFLAGQPSNYTQTFGNTYRGFRTNYHGAFVQDDVRVRSTLTLNLGLRWEYQGSLREANGLTSVLDPALGGGPLGSFRTTSPAVDSNPALFAPRFGFNWNPRGGRAVIRGGYGIYWDSLIFNGLQAGRTTPPLNYIATLSGSQISGPYSFERLLAGNVDFVCPTDFFGRVVTTDPNLRNPYVQQFNFGVQYRVRQSLVADISYVGTKGSRLTVYGPANSVVNPPAPATSPADEQARLSEFRAAIAQQNGPGNTRLDPRFNDVDRIWTGGSSIYHSLQTELRKTFSHGLAVMASYTWSKSIDNSSDYTPGQQTTDFSFAQDQFDLRSERAVSTFDIPHRLILTQVWQLPAGFVFSSINQFQSGIPATMLAGPRLGITDVNLDGNLVQGGDNTRANCDSSQRYSQPLLGNIGTCGRNTARMNPLVNLDWSIAKMFLLRESGPAVSGPYRMEVRADLFNALNIPFLTATGSDWRTVSSPQFGRMNAAGASRRVQMALRLTW